ncbi:serine-rich adhesin for platelets [Ochlerotatus camptorhynchus]|uniref:serine-rich adhesin for platelets n=1 Tax=Ochlerotatus camptorhynchus TaxID=644619 RepID=UPI0031E18F8C
MSRLFMNTTYLDEANGNTLLTHPSTGAAATVGVVDQVATTATVVANETLIIQSASNDDLSQSLSEYTDADESISAPTELLAEFLSAVMLRDYVNALKYCKLILQYEPNNSTARDFYPHILSKIASEASNGGGGGGGTEQLSGESDENYNFNYSTSSSNSDDINIDEVVMVCSSESEQSSNCSSFLDYSNSSGGNNSSSSSSSGSGGEELDEQALNRINSNSTESDQLPPSQSATDNNTSHSYSSLLLEEEEKDLTLSDISNLNIEDDENDSGDGPGASHSSSKVDTHQSSSVVAAQPIKAQPSLTSSPKTQSSTPLASKIVAMLRARVIPSKHSSAND